jgi:hypothetical protein
MYQTQIYYYYYYYYYKSRSDELKEGTIEAAKHEFLRNFVLSEYDGCDMEIMDAEVVVSSCPSD